MDEDIDLTPDLEDVTEAEQAMDLADTTLERFLDAASVEMVYGEPVQHGDTLIIPAAELVAALGFGVGAGSFVQPNKQKEEAKGEAQEEVDEEKEEEGPPAGSGRGGGGGGGGRILSRPVAVIVVSPDGVTVKPVVDTTKIALAALTAAGFMISMVARMRRGPRF